MLELFRRNPTALLLALLLHVAIVLLMVFGLDWLSPPRPRLGDTPPVQARLVAEDPVARRQAEAAAKARAAREARLQAEREAKARAAREARLQAEREAKARAAREAKLQAQREAKARAAHEARLKAEQAAREQAAREAKAAAAQAAREKAAREAREKAAAEARARAEQQAREQAMAAEMETERLAGERGDAISAIRSKIEHNWLRPPGSDHLKCVVRVRLGPSGSVLLVQIKQSSGNGAFDRSVENAVRKADPLPMPESTVLQAEFRDLTFVFDPDNE